MTHQKVFNWLLENKLAAFYTAEIYNFDSGSQYKV